MKSPSEIVFLEPTQRYVWYVILLLAVVNVFNYMDRFALSVLAPFIQSDLGISDAQLGMLTGFAFSIFYAICGVPIARIADRGVRRDVIAAALTVWSAATALSGAATNFWHLFLARVGVGAGEAGGLAPAQSIICDYVPLKRRPGIFALHNLGLVVGMMLGMALAGWLAEIIGWRWTFVAFGLPGMVLAVLVRLTLREPTRGTFDAKDGHVRGATIPQTAKFLWSCKTYKLLALAAVMGGFINFGQGQWWPSFYARVHELSVSSIGVMLGTTMGVGAGIGMLIGGFMSDRAGQRDIRLPLMIGAAAHFVAVAAIIAALFVPSGLVSIGLVGLAQLCLSTSTGPITAAMYSVVRPNMRATGGTVVYFFSTGLGFGLGPWVVGIISGMLKPSLGADSLRYALLVPTVLFPILIATLFRAARQLPTDLRAVGAAVEGLPGADSSDHEGIENKRPMSLSR